MIYAPKHIAPRRVDTLMTQIDVAPTVLGLLGLPYEAPFFGQDVLHTPAAVADRALQPRPRRGDLPRRPAGRARARSARCATTCTTVRMRQFERTGGRDPALDALGIAYFQTAAELFQAHRYE